MSKSIWPVLPELHSAVEQVDVVFDELGIERTGDITSRYSNDPVYHHYRVVVPCSGSFPDVDCSETDLGAQLLEDDDGDVYLEEAFDDRAIMVVDTHGIGS